jgi:hypothetical protein
MEHDLSLGHLLVEWDTRVVQIRVEQDCRERQNESCVCRGEGLVGAQMGEKVPSKGFHDAIDALRLARQSEVAKKHPQRLVKARIRPREVKEPSVLQQHLLVEGVLVWRALTDVLANLRLAQTRGIAQKLSHRPGVRQWDIFGAFFVTSKQKDCEI